MQTSARALLELCDSACPRADSGRVAATTAASKDASHKGPSTHSTVRDEELLERARLAASTAEGRDRRRGMARAARPRDPEGKPGQR